ncbi:ABC transporter permease [Paenibacillus sp. NFR01]|uniref:ABC transporter permease n=1 Tax=Paenibacillus sp. NFR01 TaxID=1566279 RepID=UPI0008CF554C|nr:ABC transporter permease [Paenibacillus sp. NFR01]SET86357.1 peptide/nickel transport system permease protein [Paenibacillus sp. NFR01]
MAGTVAATRSDAVKTSKKRSNVHQGWKRFKNHKLAVIGLVWVVLFILAGTIGPLVAPYDYRTGDFLAINQGPTLKHIFGTDNVGHDMFSQILYSIQSALIIAVGATLVSFVIGIILGLWAGLRGGLADVIIMRGVDFMMTLPGFLFALILVILLGRGYWSLILAIGIPGWAGYARLIRSLVLGMRNGEMVEAATALGASQFHIARRYMLPNVIGSMGVALAFGIPGDLTQIAGLSIFGMGLQPPIPSFGNMIAQASANILGFPWLLYFPAGIFAITLLSFLFVADGLQEAFSPKGGN